MCSPRISLDSEQSLFEALPRDILVQISCGVNHKDLKQVFMSQKRLEKCEYKWV
ncbi:hypothetical protein GLYMA_15G069000v4 [Glycine max]|uniref:F-box domain-containing protein n=1 Tax=Glycine max TaxID=3847 RepID=A0A0R0G719_SOYBN|nr:hypothetical protein GYH30_041581 [Glycine max]KRH10773.1 hypothetical protein GLYMA_15G069000v4 [Glycine max]